MASFAVAGLLLQLLLNVLDTHITPEGFVGGQLRGGLVIVKLLEGVHCETGRSVKQRERVKDALEKSNYLHRRFRSDVWVRAKSALKTGTHPSLP